MANRRKTLWLAGCVAAAALLGGCQGTSATYPFDRDTVWQAVVGETIVWRPTDIDPEEYRVECVRREIVAGPVAYWLEVHYWLEVRRNRFALPNATSTRVTVSMMQTGPSRLRLKDQEKAFLRRLSAKLGALTGKGP